MMKVTEMDRVRWLIWGMNSGYRIDSQGAVPDLLCPVQPHAITLH